MIYLVGTCGANLNPDNARNFRPDPDPPMILATKKKKYFFFKEVVSSILSMELGVSLKVFSEKS